MMTELTQQTFAGAAGFQYYTLGPSGRDLLVLLHPAFGDHRCFAGQIAAFSGDLRLMLIDLPGHGRSNGGGGARLADTGALIAELIAGEPTVRAHLVGVSLGSLLAQDIAARIPQRIASLTVVGGYPIFGAGKAIQRAQSGELLKWLPMIALSMEWFRRYVARQAVIQPEAREAFYHSARQFTRGSFRALAGMDAMMRLEFQAQPCPLQIIVGEHDRPLIREQAVAWQRAEPGSMLHLIPDAGHCANMDQPARFNWLLRAFINSVAVSSAAVAHTNDG